MEGDLLANIGRDVVEVGLVVDGHDDLLDPGPDRAKHLLLHTTDREHPSGKRELTGHRDIPAYFPPRHRRDKCGRHGDTGRRSIFRNRAGRHVDVDLTALESIFGNAQTCVVRFGEGERGAAGLLHDLAELTRQDKAALTGHHARLDEHDVTAHGRIEHARRDTQRIVLRHPFRMDAWPTEQFADILWRRIDLVEAAARDPSGDLARKFADFALKLSHSSFPGIALHDREDRIVLHAKLGFGEAVLLPLTLEQVPLHNLELLGLGISREVDALHSIEEWTRNPIQIVRRGDEQHLGKVERNPQIVIDEGRVLCRVEHLEQRGARVALEGHAKLVYLVQQEDRVLRLCLTHTLDDSTRHGTDIRTTVAPNVRFVPSPTE